MCTNNSQTNDQGPVRYSDQIIQTIRDRINLIELVGRDISLKKDGVNFVGRCLFHNEKTASLKIRAGAQFFKCFGCGAGGDVFHYLMKAKGVSFPEVVKVLAAQAGVDLDNPSELPPKNTKPKPTPADWIPILPVPDTAPEPDFHHYKYGQPSAVWAYYNSNGILLGFARRFEPEGGKPKQIIPLTFCGSSNGKKAEWRAKQFPEPRPLYGLDKLAAMPSHFPVVILEGEKSVDAGQKLLPNHVCMTWPGGGNAVPLADWSVLKDRHITIIPDADEPGLKAANTILEILS
jgi:putative DNA primase/helicase